MDLHLNLKTSRNAMTVVLQKFKISLGDRFFFFYMYLLQKGTRRVAISFERLPVFRKKIDVQIILQFSGCLFATNIYYKHNTFSKWGVRWLSGRVSDSGARGPGLETYRRRVVSLSKTLYSPKVLVNYPGSDSSVPT